MKPPTVSELREIAVNHNGGSDFQRHQISRCTLSEAEALSMKRLCRTQKLIALACERWAEQIDARNPSA